MLYSHPKSSPPAHEWSYTRTCQAAYTLEGVRCEGMSAMLVVCLFSHCRSQQCSGSQQRTQLAIETAQPHLCC